MLGKAVWSFRFGGPASPQPLLKVYDAAELQDGIGVAVVDRHAIGEVRKGRQAGHVRQGENIARAVASGENRVVEHLGIPVAMQEPVLDGAFEREVTHAVGEEERSAAVGPRASQDRLQVRHERHQVDARGLCHGLIVPIVAIQEREVDDPPERRPTQRDDCGVEGLDT